MEEPLFSSDKEALDYFRSLATSLQSDLDDTKLALDEFQASSKELETELEKELQATEKQLKDLRGREESLLHEVDQWKTKYHSSLKEQTKTMSLMQSELETCRKSNEEYRTRLRDMELDNDELEGKERMVTSSLQDVEAKYGKAIERITLLEDEIIGKSQLDEEHQRLKDDFRDMTEELAILRQHVDNSSTQNNNVTTTIQGEVESASTSFDPPSSPVTSKECKETEFGSPEVVETLKDLDDMASPLRPMMRTRPASSIITQPAQESPRRRLASMGIHSETASGRSPSSKLSSPSQIRKAGSLRINLSGSTGSHSNRSLQNVFKAEPLLVPSTHSVSNVKLAKTHPPRHQASPQISSSLNNLSSTPSNRAVSFQNTSKGSSNIQSLRAETQRMQGMTKKLVGSRVLRTGSAIPVPKTISSSSLSTNSSMHPHGKLNTHISSNLHQSMIARSPSIKSNHVVNPNGINSSVRSFTQPPPSQDLDSVSNSNSLTPQITGLPRARLSRPLSRLSTGSSEQYPTSTGINISSNEINNTNTLLPRRKTSIDLTFDRHKFQRPLSIQDGMKDQHLLRRQSAGLVHSSNRRPDQHLSKSHLNQYHNLLGQSLHESKRSFPTKKL